MKNTLSFKLLCFQAVIFALMFTVFNTTISEAQQNLFNVDSYIPERFTDTEWKISGGFGLRSNDYEYDNPSDPMNSYILDKVEWDGDSQNIGFQNYYRYRYETIPKYLDARFSIYISGIRDNYYQLRENEDIHNNYYKDIEDSEYKSYSISFSPDVDCGIYLYDDFFLSSENQIDFRYHNNPKNSGTNERLQKYKYSNGNISSYFDRNTCQKEHNDKSLNAAIYFLPGWGKVYEGEFASTAIYIIDDLRENNLLAQTPSDKQMHDLSEIIYQYRQKHSIDSRLHKIETIEALGNYLLDEGIITNPGPRGYMLIEDIWSYYHNFSRRFGIKIKAGFGFDYENENREHTSTNEYYTFDTQYHEDSTNVIDTLELSDSSVQRFSINKRNSRMPCAIVKVEYYKPFNHRWQLDVSAQARYYSNAYSEITYSKSGSIRYKRIKTDYKDYYNLNWDNTLRYILSSRTYADLISRIGYSYLNKEITVHTEIDSTVSDEAYAGTFYNDWHSSFALKLIYRISVPTTLTITGIYNSGYDGGPRPRPKPIYGSSGSTDRKVKGISLIAGITYHIF